MKPQNKKLGRANIILYNPANKNDYYVIASFPSTEACDHSTVQYENDRDFVNNSIYSDIIKSIPGYKHLCMGILTNSKEPIFVHPMLYSCDFFDTKSVIDAFCDYYSNNPQDVLKNWHIGIENMLIQHSDSEERIKLKYVGECNDVRILLKRARNFLESDTHNYKKIRDVYFQLKKRKIPVKIIDLYAILSDNNSKKLSDKLPEISDDYSYEADLAAAIQKAELDGNDELAAKFYAELQEICELSEKRTKESKKKNYL